MSSRRPRPYRLWFEQLETRLSPAVMFADSLNWAGYALVSARNSISYIGASWTVPAVSGAQSGYSATWVGMDGVNSKTVQQIGTEADLVNGVASYYAWYEMYPAPSVIIPQAIYPVSPLDNISASVSYARGQGFTLTIMDYNSWSAPFTTTVKAAAARSSAEAVVEAPSYHGVLPLANYGTETLNGVTVTVGKQTSAIGAAAATHKVEQMNMTTRDGVTVQTTSPLSLGGNSFTVAYDGNQNAAGSVGSVKPVHGTSHDVNQTIIVITITVPSISANLPFVTLPLPLPPITVSTLLPASAQPPTTVSPPPILIDPFVGSGISDVLPAQDNGADRGGVPAGPVQVPPVTAPMAPTVPAVQQQSRLDTGLPAVSYFATDTETALLQDESTRDHELTDVTERTVEAAGVIVLLGLGLGTSCGVSLGDREARKKPISL